MIKQKKNSLENYDLSDFYYLQGLIYKPMNPRPQLTPDEALRILNKINFYGIISIYKCQNRL